jgi:hypothetical protein
MILAATRDAARLFLELGTVTVVLSLSRSGFWKFSDGLEPEIPSLPCAPIGSWSQPWQRFRFQTTEFAHLQVLRAG